MIPRFLKYTSNVRRNAKDALKMAIFKHKNLIVFFALLNPKILSLKKQEIFLKFSGTNLAQRLNP